MRDVQLTENFWLSEFVKSQTAHRQNIDNWPKDDQIIENLRTLCEEILQPLRFAFEEPIYISSGYRCPELNQAIGGSSGSQHMTGQAADFEIFSMPNKDLAEFIRDNFNFDQLILEFWYEDKGVNSGWIHCSYVSLAKNRNEVLTINKNGAFHGLGT